MRAEHTDPNPFEAGRAAYKSGKPNPYKSRQREWKRWMNGWQAAQREAIEVRPLPEWAVAQEALK